MPVLHYRRTRTALWPVVAACLLPLGAGAQTAATVTQAEQAPAEAPRTEEEIIEATPDEQQALEDYEASEQISEDLSVSFPVDI